MRPIEILNVEDAQEWHRLLADSLEYDFYHMAEYHRIAQDRNEGTPLLFIVRDGKFHIALPLLIRLIEDDHLQLSAGKKMYDATSVYGYVGPVVSRDEPPGALFDTFADSLISALSDLNVVSMFSRLHPLIAVDPHFDRYFERTFIGQTVSINLTIPADAQLSQYRSSHRQEINKLKRSGFHCHEDLYLDHLNDFIRMYYDTMDNVKADRSYYFPRSYFDTLFTKMNDTMHLFICHVNGAIACGGIFSLCGGIVQYHLSGTNFHYKKYAPIKLLLDHVRSWGIEHCAHTFHLGGGVGSANDTLFQFKAGFSSQRHDFHVWKTIIKPNIYQLFCDRATEYIRHHLNIDNKFFPHYHLRERNIMPLRLFDLPMDDPNRSAIGERS